MGGWVVEIRSRRLFQKRVSVCHRGVCTSETATGAVARLSRGVSALIGEPLVVVGGVFCFVKCLPEKSHKQEIVLRLLSGLRACKFLGTRTVTWTTWTTWRRLFAFYSVSDAEYFHD